VSGLWSFDDADGLRPGTYQVRPTIGDEASERLTMTVP
jgi:hypothetical protein